MLPESYHKLLEMMREVADLDRAAAVLDWDRLTYMPAAGGEARGEQTATLARLSHLRSTSPEVGAWLEELRPYEQSLAPDSDEASMIRVARREYEKARRIPTQLVVEQELVAAAAHEAWLKAREENRFEVFRPALERVVDVSRRVAAALGYVDSPMDAFIDVAEPGITAAFCEGLFAELRAELVPLARAIAESGHDLPHSVLRGDFPAERQLACGIAAVRAIGFDLDGRGRVDTTVHPFAIGCSLDDVRITTRISPDDFGNCFFSLMHEAGHGMYDQGLPRRLDRTVLADGASGGVHESQSRLWENLVGRSREFWEYFLPKAREFFPEQFAGVTPDAIYRAVNRVTPSLIRTDADEVTYNLHVMFRFDLEKAVLEGRLAVADLRDAWQDKLREYLGLTAPDDLRGILQDIHWSGHFGGSFQSYTLGNVMAGQLYSAALADHPEIPEDIARGQFGKLFDWMRTRVHESGAKFPPLELVQRATGKPVHARPYLDYLTRKFRALYGLT
jgi:carboxypeptidase Taq